MAKLMAPNIRIDWYPEGHFQDIHNPTIAELNSGVNLSCAIVTGYTLDFTDSNTGDTTTIFDTHASESILNHSYEADLEFFLAPRGSNAENEAAYRKAEELFYNPENRVGYLAKRFGFPWNQEYTWEQPRQRVDLFKVQADLPKVVSEDGAPILLNVKYIPQGKATSGAKAGNINYRWESTPYNSASLMVLDDHVYTYAWAGEPGNSESIKYKDGVEIARNIIPSPRLLNTNDTAPTSTTTGGVTSRGDLFPELGDPISDEVYYFTAVDKDSSSVYSTLSYRNSPSLTKGFWYAGSIWVNVPEGLSNRVRFPMQFRSAANPTWSATVAEEYHSGTLKLQVVGQVEGDDPQSWWVFWPSELRDVFGENVYIAGVILSDASTSREEALSKVESYFDGDTPTQYGDIVAKNWHHNPQGESAASYGAGTGGYVIQKYIENATDTPNPNIHSYRRAYIAEPAPTGSGAWASTSTSQRAEINAALGDWVSYTYYVRYTGAAKEVYYTPRIYFRDSSGASISFHTKPRYYHPSGEWVRVVMTHEIPEGTRYVNFWNYFVSGENAPPGSTVDFTSIFIGIGDTEEEAIRQATYFFDGDSVDRAKSTV